ncbi:serine hydrolase domain-containing protein [Rivularia sp. UHCC 0363]|uniref:serine hydrolase domain-containing protein n=1 Tax=Rivularia sp. UHCC 0363 TaxID=3110244 RepID=UPI002B1F96E2|nr:serine hydrolase domain-containing protein [Rivularia sp. UHCC 0363]MEA5596780.1 serine hydrolase domain-containing protein [Rivularia sp. UHCC 0363]
MSEISRRRLLKQSATALIGLSSINLLNLLANSTSAAETAIDNLETQIYQLMRNFQIPGISIAMIRDGELFWHKSFGVKHQYTKKPVTDETIFAAASLSKPLFAYVVLKMVERGEIDLDKPLTAYTDKPLIPDPRIKLVTARRVLSHTTGFPNWSGDKPVWINNTPGSKFAYSGEGFLYLQTVVEKITGQPLEAYLQQQILKPWGMNRSSFIWQPEYQTTASYGHNRQNQPKPMSQPKAASSAGSLRTTASEYAQLLIAMMKPEASLQQMLTPQIKLSDSLDWGLGWGLEKTNKGNFFWHWGDLVTFKSFTVASKDLKTGIVILTNSQNGLKICGNIVNQAIGGKHPAFKYWMIDY